MNIAFITCFAGVLGMCAGASLAEGKPCAGKTEPERLALVSPAFPLNPEGKWSLKRKSRPAELYRKKVAVSHMDQEYTFQSHEDAQVKLVHGVLANALVSGNNRSKSYNSFKVSRPTPPPPPSS